MTKKSIKDISDDVGNLILDNINKIKDFFVDLIPKTTLDLLDVFNFIFILFLFFLSFRYFKMEFKFFAAHQKEKSTRL